MATVECAWCITAMLLVWFILSFNECEPPNYTDYRVFTNMSNTTAECGYPSKAPDISHIFCWGSYCSIFINLCCVLCTILCLLVCVVFFSFLDMSLPVLFRPMSFNVPFVILPLFYRVLRFELLNTR